MRKKLTRLQSTVTSCIRVEFLSNQILIIVSPSVLVLHRQFCEADIDELLTRGSRVVQIGDERREEDARPSALNFSKTSFQVTENDADLDFNDPEFWTKVLGRDSRETLLQRLKDEHMDTEADKERFLQEVFQVAQQVIEQKLDGNPQPPHLGEIMSVLVEITAMKRRFRCVLLFMSLWSLGCKDTDWALWLLERTATHSETKPVRCWRK